MRRSTCLVAFLAPWLACAACGEVLGIEDASLDPALRAKTGKPLGVVPVEAGVVKAADAGTPASELCEQYCSTVMASCPGPDSVYANILNCYAVCALLPEGAPGDEIGNTVHCRLRAAEAAPSEPNFYCPAAAPGGNGVCGSNCEGLCTIVGRVCQGDNRKWDSALACKADCDSVKDLQTYTTSSEVGMSKGDHVQCRLYHVSAAAVKDPGLHCPHIAGALPCATKPPPPPPMAGADAAAP